MPGSPLPRAPVASAAPVAGDGPCVTFRDAELGCDRRCDSIEPVLQRCAARAASGSLTVAWSYEGDGPAVVRIEAEGSGLAGPSACVARVFARFVPCLRGAGRQEGTVRLRFVPRAHYVRSLR